MEEEKPLPTQEELEELYDGMLQPWVEYTQQVERYLSGGYNEFFELVTEPPGEEPPDPIELFEATLDLNWPTRWKAFSVEKSAQLMDWMGNHISLIDLVEESCKLIVDEDKFAVYHDPRMYEGDYDGVLLFKAPQGENDED